MEKVSNQQTPLWERSSSERGGHLSSVDKAVQAHRDRVDARQMRTQNRLNASREISSGFFLAPENRAPLATQTDGMAFDSELIQDPTLALQPLLASAIEDTVEELPMGMDDLYQDISASPVRAYAEQIIEGDTMEDRLDNQSDEVPKGTFVDYNV